MLVADIGNTDITFGIFRGEKLSHSFRIPSNKTEGVVFFEYRIRNFFLENGIGPNSINLAVLSSVVPELTIKLSEILSRITGNKAILIHADIHPKVKVNIDNPAQLGTDIYANCVSAYHKYEQACVIVDFGTALTLTAVDKNGNILGVAIAPGLNSAVKALFSNTSQLPEVPLILPERAIGKNTITAIQSGVLLGYEGLVKNLLLKFKQEIGGTIKVIATGGLSKIIPGLVLEFDEVDINLTLNGLRIIGEASISK